MLSKYVQVRALISMFFGISFFNEEDSQWFSYNWQQLTQQKDSASLKGNPTFSLNKQRRMKCPGFS